MREGSALLERLEKRFEAIDSRADRRSVGMRQRDSFLSHFSARMKELQNLVQVSEMSAFRRLPKIGKSFDPWGNMGGWSVLQDLVYLEWLEEQEIEAEEIEQPRVSAWGTATSASPTRKNSAWLNTPYTPARVAGKPLPKPQMRGERGERVGSSSRPQRTKTAQKSKPRRATAPTLAVSPLKRAMGRATVAQERVSSSARVINSLPPMLAKTTGKRWVESSQNQAKQGPSTRSSLRSPMLKMVDREMEVGSSDALLSQSRLASQRLMVPSKTNLLASNEGKETITRGLRTSIPKLENVSKVKANATGTQVGMDADLATTVRREVIRAVQVAVPAQVSKTIKQIGVGSAQKTKSSKQAAEVIERLVLNEAQSQVESIFQSASVGSLEQLAQSAGTTQGAIRRVKTIVTDVVKQIVKQVEQNGVVERAVRQEDPTGLSEASTITFTNEQRKVVVQRLQSKGVRRQLAERILDAVAPTQQDVQSSVSEVMSRVLEVVESSDGQQDTLSKRSLTKQVRRQLTPLLEQSKVKTVLSKSLLPSVAGEDLSDRIIADVVNEIAAYADRETLVENSEGQRQLMNSLERTVSKLVTKTRRPQMSMDSDWVDVQAFGQSTIEEGEEQESTSSVSPWFTREVDVTETRSLQPMQQAAARVLKLVSENPTRPEIIARQTGLKVQEVQQIVESIQGFEAPNQKNRKVQIDTIPTETVERVLKLVSENPSRPEVVARQTGLSVAEVRKLTGAENQSFGSLNTVAARMESKLNDAPAHPLESLWERATSPIDLPEWKGIGTSSFKPTIGESAKGWRLSPKRRPVHPYAVDVDSTVLQPSMSMDSELEAENATVENKPSPWLSRKNTDISGFGFVPQTISGDAKLSSNEIAMFGGQSKTVQLNVGDVQNQQARWLEPNRTVVLDNGTVIHAKVAKRLGLDVKTASKQNLPLSWTLEGLQLKSDHKSLPTWAKRASGKPQVKASPEFLVALAKASSAEDVAEVILQNSGRSNDGVLPKTAMTAIDQIRREAHRSLKGMESLQQEMQQEMVNSSRTGRDRTRRRVSRTARAVADGLTGLKPISMATPTSSTEAQGTDKVSKLAKQLESLVSMAENNRRDEARDGVRMAEESHDAIAEGQAASKSEERDYAVDIEALRQEVMRAFEQEMSIRNLRSFDGSNNTDPWW